MLTIYERGCAGRACAGLLLTAASLFLAAMNVPAIAGNTLPSETPAAFVPRTDSFDYVKREVMIPMRDGVHLQTVVITKANQTEPLPILLTQIGRAHV